MKILVCVKQVPNTNEVKINPKTGTLIRDGVESILNPDDDNALEAALQMKDGNTDTTAPGERGSGGMYGKGGG